MRLHRLTVTAFGPFAGSETIDFEELNDAGLFLLTGPTGAGKSSLLDAVCFALYGSVPGARGVKTLKSQHAPVDREPEVVLDFTVRDRRFVVRRSPEWSRPKRRGDGLITEKARAAITETTGGVEHFLSARAAEVGLLVTDLMGMNASQFSQVALLPQGEFQTFLRASSQERHDVLQHLFRTDRFARIEEWVHEHSRDLRQRSTRDRSTVQRLLDSVADRMGVPTPEDLSGDLLPQATADGRVLAWAGEQVALAAAALGVETARHDEVESTRREAEARHATAVRRAEQSTRRAAASCCPARARGDGGGGGRGRGSVSTPPSGRASARRCSPCSTRPSAPRVRPRTHGTRPWRQVATVVPGGDPSELDRVTLTGHARTFRARSTRLEALLPREAAGRAAARDLESARTGSTAAEDELARATRRAVEVPAEIAELTVRFDELGVLAARREALGLSLTAARRRARAATDLVGALADVTRLGDAHREARDRSLTAREHLQEVVARRLAEMAAELAGGLVEGAPCQVCGSTTHPVPAEPAHDAVGAEDQEAAEARVSAAGTLLETASTALRDAEHRRDTCAAEAEGLSVQEADAEVRALADALAEAEQAAEERGVVEQRLHAARLELTGLTERQAAAATVIAGLRQAMTGHEETIRTVAEELSEAGAVGGSVQEAADELVVLADLVERTADVVDDRRTRPGAGRGADAAGRRLRAGPGIRLRRGGACRPARPRRPAAPPRTGTGARPGIGAGAGRARRDRAGDVRRRRRRPGAPPGRGHRRCLGVTPTAAPRRGPGHGGRQPADASR